MGTATVMARILTIEKIPVILANMLTGLTDSRIVVLLLMNIFLIGVGCVMDGTPAVMILAPILQPIAISYGVDPIHFGLMMVLNISIGFITPPVGLNLYVACSIGKIKFVELIRGLLPFFIAMLVTLLLVTYIPSISLLIPRLFGYAR
ncbi:C4-dicarboxylate TRAP transporter large permease protein DctM [bioreactor metagenome]|uniref:C4-dicarboxylate TRAP transporter large permease protein DctM n=1 Tax=bioreactor metagenome TaxID=1076179 RepID=A0A645AR56_9ZZZZ